MIGRDACGVLLCKGIIGISMPPPLIYLTLVVEDMKTGLHKIIILGFYKKDVVFSLVTRILGWG